MKVRASSSARIITQMVTHYRHAVHQHNYDTGTVPAFGMGRADKEPRTLHAMPVAAAAGRKVKLLKSGVRRISYR